MKLTTITKTMAMAKVVGFIVGFLLSVASIQAKTDKRNVLIIIGDDAGFEMGAYNNSVCKTPNLDRLARRGVTFTRGYTSTSTCSPSRASILTGLPQHQSGQYGLFNTDYHFQTFDSVRSLPVILSEAGLHTGIVGKKHIGPGSVYKFDYEQTEMNNEDIQVSRNITLMKSYVREFFKEVDTRPFFLYVGMKDPHRAQAKDLERYGQFAERFGSGEEGMGTIHDWDPVLYSPADVLVPSYLPDNTATRQDIAAQYTSMSRLDAGVGMLLDELDQQGVLDDTLIIYSGDNGIPFLNAKTNLYEMGMREPMLVSSPHHPGSWGTTSDALINTLDFLPTVLDWVQVPFPRYETFPNRPARLTGASILPLLSCHKDREEEEEVVHMVEEEDDEGIRRRRRTFASQSMHEITMYYPMRAMREGNLHLIHNLNHREFFPIATDIVVSPTFVQLLADIRDGRPTGWFKTLQDFYYRPEWELYDVVKDPLEVENLAEDPAFKDTLRNMKARLEDWQIMTFDPWRCYPDAVLFNNEVCIPILNEIEKCHNQSCYMKDEL